MLPLGRRTVARLTFFRSAARGLHVPTKLTPEPTNTRRGSAGPANGRESAAAKSWAARLRQSGSAQFSRNFRKHGALDVIPELLGPEMTRPTYCHGVLFQGQERDLLQLRPILFGDTLYLAGIAVLLNRKVVCEDLAVYGECAIGIIANAPRQLATSVDRSLIAPSHSECSATLKFPNNLVTSCASECHTLEVVG